MSRTAPPHMPPPRPNKAKHLPKNPIAAFFWRQWVWVEGTFVFSMLEAWEVALILTIFTFFFVLFGIAVTQYLPQHVMLISKRAAYYIWGTEGEDRFFKQWLSSAGLSDAGKLE
ncbi:hypothetical protein DL96DRAFT_1620533, partial [Flagelloscypha sp. PMI_526]